MQKYVIFANVRLLTLPNLNRGRISIKVTRHRLVKILQMAFKYFQIISNFMSDRKKDDPWDNLKILKVIYKEES